MVNLAAASNYFENYTRVEPLVPVAVWRGLRAAMLAGSFGLAALMLVNPALGLRLFWGVIIPLLPLLLVIAPGLWRQVCPMAFLNQMPRIGGFSRGLDLPDGLRGAAFTIALVLFIGAVAMRAPLFNQSGTAVAALILAALALAFAGGLVFKGRSGWCGTFCPLGPVQRAYGQAPLVLVRNGYCSPCVGCQKNCYDFNPRATVFSDIYDDDARYAAQRRLFMGLLPGLVLGYYLLGPTTPDNLWHYWATLAGACVLSAGSYSFAVSFVPLNPYRISLIFGAAALASFYWFAGPIVVHNLSAQIGVTPANWVPHLARGVGFLAALALAGSGLVSELRYRIAQRTQSKLRVESRTAVVLKGQPAERGGRREALDRESGAVFEVPEGVSLLDAIQSAGLKISFGCRAGVCGADAVAVLEGKDNLAPPGEEELGTLRRLGLVGRARLACMCQVKGPVTISRDPRAAPESAQALAAPMARRAEALGIRQVVIIGNGVAGLSAAEALRADSDRTRITIVANEASHFYNRMAIGRLIYDGTAMDGLQLNPDAWYAGNDVRVLRNTVATALDRGNRRVVLAAGEPLPYDRLILATGARAARPTPDFFQFSNAFALRTLEDAQRIRSFVQQTGARRAVVIGGGVLGIEAADALQHLGLQVIILQRSDRLMSAQLDATGAARLAAYLESLNVQTVVNATVARFDGGESISRVWLAHGPRIRADLVVACLGIEPNIHLARAAELETGRGIRVDAVMRTSDPAIFAVGDAAEPPTRGPLGLWPVGAAQAGVAVGAMLGADRPAAAQGAVVRLKCDGIDVLSFGALNPPAGSKRHCSPPDEPAWWSLSLSAGELVGGLFVGPPGSGKAFAALAKAPQDAALCCDFLDRAVAATAPA